MENRMDRLGQPPGDDDQSPSSELFQEQSIASTTSAEQRLKRRIMWLTLLLRIMIGIFLALFGGLCYVLAGFIPYAFYPTSPIIYRLLGPLMMTSFGFVAILSGRVQHLRRQHSAFRLGRFDLLEGYSSWPLTSGLLFIWLGSSNVILLCFRPDPHMWGTVEMGGVVVLVIALFIELFLKNRHTVQQ